MALFDSDIPSRWIFGFTMAITGISLFFSCSAYSGISVVVLYLFKKYVSSDSELLSNNSLFGGQL